VKNLQTDTSDQFASLRNPIKPLLSVRWPHWFITISAYGGVPAAHDWQTLKTSKLYAINRMSNF